MVQSAPGRERKNYSKLHLVEIPILKKVFKQKIVWIFFVKFECEFFVNLQIFLRETKTIKNAHIYWRNLLLNDFFDCSRNVSNCYLMRDFKNLYFFNIFEFYTEDVWKSLLRGSDTRNKKKNKYFRKNCENVYFLSGFTSINPSIYQGIFGAALQGLQRRRMAPDFFFFSNCLKNAKSNPHCLNITLRRVAFVNFTIEIQSWKEISKFE